MRFLPKIRNSVKWNKIDKNGEIDKKKIYSWLIDNPNYTHTQNGKKNVWLYVVNL